MNYDPSFLSSGNTAIQTVTLTFGAWEYRAQMIVEVPGNLRGFSVMDFAVERVLEKLPMDGVVPEITMTNAAGETMIVSDDDLRGDLWLKDCLLAAEIVNIVPVPW